MGVAGEIPRALLPEGVTPLLSEVLVNGGAGSPAAISEECRAMILCRLTETVVTNVILPTGAMKCRFQNAPANRFWRETNCGKKEHLEDVRRCFEESFVGKDDTVVKGSGMTLLNWKGAPGDIPIVDEV